MKIKEMSENSVVVYINTIIRSQLDLEYKASDTEHKYYEVISFDSGPISFSSVLFLYPGEIIKLRDDETEFEFKSETSTEIKECNLRVLVRIVRSDGNFTFIELHRVEDNERHLTFVCNDQDIMVDAIIIIGSLSSLSFAVLRNTNVIEFGSRWDFDKKLPLYYGEYVLDYPKSYELPKNITYELHDFDVSTVFNTYILENRTNESKFNTFLEFVDHLYMKELLNTAESKSLTNLIRNFTKGSLVEFENLHTILTKHLYYNRSIYQFNVELDDLTSLVNYCCDEITFNEDNFYILLRTLLSDCNISLNLMRNKNFVSDIILKLTGNDHIGWIQRECMLTLLSDFISTPSCMKLFLTVENDKSLYDTLVQGIVDDHQYSNDKLYQILVEIGNKVMLYSLLSGLKELFNELYIDDFKVDGQFCDSILILSESINGALDLIDKLHKPFNSSFVYTKDLYNYIMLYINDMNFCQVLEYLLKSIRYLLSNFPIASFDFYRILNKPFKFVLKNFNNFDFGGLVLESYSISKLMLDLYLDTEVSIRKGFPYDGTHLKEFAERLHDKAYDGLIHLSIVRLIIDVILNYESTTSIGVIDVICKSIGYEALSNVLSNDVVSKSLINLLNDSMDNLRNGGDDDGRLLMLLNILSSGIISSGNMIYSIGRRFIFILESFIEIYKPVGGNIKEITSALSMLRIIFTCVSASLEDCELSSGVLLIDNIDDFLKDLIKASEALLVNNELKQSINCEYFIKNIGSIPKDYISLYLVDKNLSNVKGSFICDRFKLSYTDDNVDLLDLDWKPIDFNRDYGVNDDEFNYFLSLNLFILPPDPLPIEVTHGLLLLRYLSLIKGYEGIFIDLLRYKSNLNCIIRLWVHAISSLSPDYDTLISVELGVFSSLLGYRWYICRKKAIVLIKNIIDIISSSLHYFSDDDSNLSVRSADIYYINDDILRLLILTSTEVIKDRKESCITSLRILIYYWYNRFKKSRGYLLNFIIESYLTIPKMALGSLFLFVSCFDDKNNYIHIDISIDDRDLYNHITVEIEDVTFRMGIKDNNDKISESICDLKMKLFINFLIIIIRRRHTMEQTSLVLNAHFLYLMIFNSVPVLKMLDILDNNLVDKVFNLKSSITEPTITVPLASTVGPADSSSNSLPVNGNATPGDRGEESETIYGSRGEVNREAATASGMKSSTGPRVEPAADLREAEGEVNGKAVCKTTSGSDVIIVNGLDHNNDMNMKSLSSIGDDTTCHESDYIRQLLLFYIIILRKCNDSTTIKTEIMFKTNLHVIKIFSKIANNILPTSSFHCLLYEGYMEIFKLYNRLWYKDTSTLVSLRDFYLFVQYLSSSTNWICNSLNSSIIDNNTPIDIILLGFMSIRLVFELPFTTLNILYSYSQSSMELLLKNIRRKIDSENIKISSYKHLYLHEIISNLCKYAISNMNNSVLYNFTIILEIIHGICKSIRSIGKSHDHFIIEMINGKHSNSAEKFSTFHMVTSILDEIISSNVNLLSKSVVVNLMTINNAIKGLSNEIVECELPKTIQGYVFVKKRSYDSVLKYFTTATSSCDLIKMIDNLFNWDMWINDIYDTLTNPYYKVELNNPFIYNGTKESINLGNDNRSIKTQLIFSKALDTDTGKSLIKRTDSFVKYPKTPGTRPPTKQCEEFQSEYNVINELPFTSKSQIKSKQWQEFDNDLSINGLSVHSIIINPLILQDDKIKKTFLYILSKHKTIYNHLISIGIDVRY